MSGRVVIPASVVLVVHRGRTLVLRRRPDDRSFASRWCLPGGRVEQGERPEQSARRETEEETGLVVELKRALGPRRVALPDRALEFEIHRFLGAADHDHVVLSEEHVAARWLTPEQAASAHDLLPGGLAGEVTEELLARFARRSWTG